MITWTLVLMKYECLASPDLPLGTQCIGEIPHEYHTILVIHHCRIIFIWECILWRGNERWRILAEQFTFFFFFGWTHPGGYSISVCSLQWSSLTGLHQWIQLEMWNVLSRYLHQCGSASWTFHDALFLFLDFYFRIFLFSFISLFYLCFFY